MEIIIANIGLWLSNPANLMLVLGFGTSLVKIYTSWQKDQDWAKALEVAIKEATNLVPQVMPNNEKKRAVELAIKEELGTEKAMKLGQQAISDIIEIAYRSRVKNK